MNENMFGFHNRHENSSPAEQPSSAAGKLRSMNKFAYYTVSFRFILRNSSSEKLIIKEFIYSDTAVNVPSALHSNSHFAYKLNLLVF
jgi:hypothetical protein